MTKVQMFGSFISQRLSAAAEEIFELFERTIAEYEEQLRRSKEENERQKKLLEAVYNPEVRLHRADIQQLWQQQERSSSLHQENPPEPPHIKEEQEELWTNQEAEQLQGPGDAGLTSLIFTPVPVKSEEDDGEDFQSLQLHENRERHFNMAAGREDRGGSEPDRNFECATASGFQKHLKENKESEQSLICPFCNKIYSNKVSLSVHLKRHSSVHGFSCLVCGKKFPYRAEFETHMRTHTGEKPFSCLFCSLRFSDKSNYRAHVRAHTGERKRARKKPTLLDPSGRCRICKETVDKNCLVRHMESHRGEKRFSCPICGKSYTQSRNMRNHVKRQHIGGEKSG